MQQLMEGFTLKPEMLKTDTTVQSKWTMERKLIDSEKAVEEVPENDSVTQFEQKDELVIYEENKNETQIDIEEAESRMSGTQKSSSSHEDIRNKIKQ